MYGVVHIFCYLSNMKYIRIDYTYNKHPEGIIIVAWWIHFRLDEYAHECENADDL